MEVEKSIDMEQTKLIGLVLELELKVKEFGILSRKFESIKSSDNNDKNIDKQKELHNLKNEFENVMNEIEKINKELESL